MKNSSNLVMSDYTITVRKRGKSGTYYARLWSSKAQRYIAENSVETLRTRLFEGSTRKITSKATAIVIAQRAFEQGLFGPGTNESRNILLSDYVKRFWNYDESDYVKTKHAYSKNGNGITRNYCNNMLSVLNRHVLTKLPEKLQLEALTDALFRKNVLMPLIREGQLSRATINSVIKCVRVPVTYAYEKEHLINCNSMANIDYLPEDERERGIPSSDEMQNLLNSMKQRDEARLLDHGVNLAIQLATVTAARLGEVRGARRDNIVITKLNDGTEYAVFRIVTSWSNVDHAKLPKSNKTRTVPIPITLAYQLLEHATRNPWKNDFIFWSWKTADAPLSANYIRNTFYNELSIIGIEEAERKKRNITVHSLRHFLNSQLTGKIPGEIMRRIIGHEDSRMTERYLHDVPEVLFGIGTIIEGIIKLPDEA